jgi:hypothetical protein
MDKMATDGGELLHNILVGHSLWIGNMTWGT